MNKSKLFSVYNKARVAARNGRLDTGRVNRALGVAQSKNARPYNTTITSCDCPDSLYRGATCKHRVALMMQKRMEQ